MNCQPGDLAIITRSRGDLNTGKLVRCEFVDRTWPGVGVEWGVTALCSMHNYRTGQVDPAGARGKAYDACLKPLRDPGDDAMDETLVSTYWSREVPA